VKRFGPGQIFWRTLDFPSQIVYRDVVSSNECLLNYINSSRFKGDSFLLCSLPGSSFKPSFGHAHGLTPSLFVFFRAAMKPDANRTECFTRPGELSGVLF
jgi:hypothetical protein